MGTFIGIALIIFSPLVLWQAESQHRAKDFAAAVQVEADDVQEGYVTFEGTVETEENLLCANDDACYYYNIDHQELVKIQEEQCGTTDGEILYRTGQQCDDDGTCEQCYMVEKEEWQTQSSESDYMSVKVGEYQVEVNGRGEMVGTKDATIMLSDTTRDVWYYMPAVDTLRVAGESRGGEVQGAGELTFVVSAYSYDQTLVELQARDDLNKWIFRLITFVMLVVGYGGVFGVLSYFSSLAGQIPIVGRFVKEGFGAIVGLITMVLATITFALEWVVIAFVKNIWIVAGLLAVIAVGVALWTKFNAKKAS